MSIIRIPALCAVLAASCLSPQIASAQGDSPGANRYEQSQRYQQSRRDDRDRRNEARSDARRDNRNDYRNENRGNDWRGHDHRAGNQHRGGDRGAGPNHSYYRGGYLPPQYRTRHYVVEDWHGHRLSAPPRGYQWVQSGGDYLLVAIATGVIVNLLLNN